MPSKSKLCSILLKLTIAICAAVGVAIQTHIFTRPNLNSFRMFTVLSNCAAFLYFLFAAAALLPRSKDGRDSPLPFLKGMVTMCLVLTGLVSLAVLTKAVNFTSPMGVSMFLLHIVTPVATVLDYLIFDKKGRIKAWMPLGWTLSPVAYTAFILTTAVFKTVEYRWRFPYPFFDFETIGKPMVCAAILLLASVYIGVGALLLLTDTKLSPKAASSE